MIMCVSVNLYRDDKKGLIGCFFVCMRIMWCMSIGLRRRLSAYVEGA